MCGNDSVWAHEQTREIPMTRTVGKRQRRPREG